MKKQKYFVGGPITYMIKNNVFDEPFRKKLFTVYDIINAAGQEILSAHLEENFGELKMESDSQIVKRDLDWIDQADICIFLFPTDNDGSAVRTDGTYIELGYACAKGKNMYVFWNENNLFSYSAMFRGMTEKNIQFYDLSKTKEVISSIV